MDNPERRRRVAACIAWGLLAVFVPLGVYLVLEIRSAQVGVWSSHLSDAEKYLWFARLQTSKAIIAFVALILGLLSASVAWRSGRTQE
jgi:predicted histidine transporter YuiF (NhaC family)